MSKAQVHTGIAVALFGGVVALDNWLLSGSGQTHVIGMVIAQSLTLVSGWLGLKRPTDIAAADLPK